MCVFLRRFTILCYASGFCMSLFLCQLFMIRVCVCVRACMRVYGSFVLFSAIEHVKHGKVL